MTIWPFLFVSFICFQLQVAKNRDFAHQFTTRATVVRAVQLVGSATMFTRVGPAGHLGMISK